MKPLSSSHVADARCSSMTSQKVTWMPGCLHVYAPSSREDLQVSICNPSVRPQLGVYFSNPSPMDCRHSRTLLNASGHSNTILDILGHQARLAFILRKRSWNLLDLDNLSCTLLDTQPGQHSSVGQSCAPRHSWIRTCQETLGAPGHSRTPWDTPGHSWRAWTLLDAPGHPWTLKDSPRQSGHLGSWPPS